MGSVGGASDLLHSSLLKIPTGSAAAALGVAALAVAVGEMGQKALEAGIIWQREITNLANAADISVEKAHEIGASFQQLSREVPQSATELAKAYESVAGRMELYANETLTAAQATELMKTAAEGAVAGNQSLSSATNALVQQMMASHSSIEDQAHVMDVLFNTSRLTGQSYDELSNIMGRMQARMGEAAPSIEGVGLAIAVMNAAGNQGARAGMMFTKMMEELAEPSLAAQQDLAAVNAQIVKNADGSLNLRATLESLTKAFKDIDDPATRHAIAVELVGKQYAGAFESALKAASGHVEEMADKIDKANTAQEAAERHSKDLEERLTKLGNQGKATAQVFGEQLAGALVKDADLMATLGESFDVMRRQYEGWSRERAAMFQGENSSADELRARAQAHIDADRREEAAAKLRLAGSDPHHPDETSTVHERAPFDSAGIRANAEAMASLGSEGQKLHNLMLDMQTASKASDQLKTMNELESATLRQADAWMRAFDPAHPSESAHRVETLNALMERYREAVKEGDTATRDATAAAIDGLNRQVVAQTQSEEQARKIDAYQKQQAAEAKRQIEEAARALHEMAITGFDEQGQHNEMMQKWGKLGGDSIVALTEALADPAHMRSAGTSLSNSIAGLTEKLHEAGVENWKESGEALVAAFRQALVDGTPGSVQAAQDLLTQTVDKLQSTEIATEWAKAQTAAQEKVDLAWANHEESMTALRERHIENQYFNESTETVRRYVDALKVTLDQDLEEQRHHDQDKLESMRLAAQGEDRILAQGRQNEDLSVNRGRQVRDTMIGQQRAQQDAVAAHMQRLADIQKQGGPGQTAAIAAEDESFRRQQASMQLQQSRATADRQRQNADQDSDQARQAARENADLARHQATALAEKAQQQQFQNEEKATAVANAEQVKNYKTTLEMGFHIDKASMDAAEETRQRAQLDRTYQHAADSYIREMTRAHDTIQQRFPGAAVPSVGNSSTITNQGAAGALGPLVVWNSYGPVGEGAPDEYKAIMEGAARQASGALG